MFGFTGHYQVVDKTNTKLEVLPYGSNKPVVVTYPITEAQLLQWRVGGLMIQEKNSILTTTISHKLNDEIEINLSHIFTNLDEVSSVGSKLKNTYSKNNLELQIKAVF